MVVPSPRTWDDGNVSANRPTGTTLEAEWAGSMKWLLGHTRPFFVGVSTSLATLTYDTFVPIAWNSETVKRGGMVHSNSTNNSRITVPDTGRYRGILHVGAGQTTTTASGRWWADVLVNGATAHRLYSATPTEDANMDFMFPFVVSLDAGNYVELRIKQQVNVTSSQVVVSSRTRVLLFHDTADPVTGVLEEEELIP